VKTTLYFAALFAALISLSIAACDAISDKNDECEATKMPERQTPTIYLNLLLRNDTILNDLYVHSAEKATFSGTITKVYCDGTVSSTFSYSPTFFPSEMDYIFLNAGFYLDQPYEFNFDNDKDYLLVIAKLKVWFSNGKIFESNDVSRKYYFKDIKYDVNQLKKFIFIPFGVNSYVEVTEK
jgi:hypothetical protein